MTQIKNLYRSNFLHFPDLNVYAKIQITMITNLVGIWTSTQTLQRELKDPFTVSLLMSTKVGTEIT